MSTDKQHLEAPLQLHYGSGLLLAGDGVRLMQAIAEHGSINRAAKAAGISYRTAWQRVESLNNLAESALVARATGGKGGGGTQLTAAGERLLALYRDMEREHQQYLQRLSARVGAAGELLPTLGRIAMQTSARNQFHGRIVAVEHGAVNAEVQLDIGAGHVITAIVTEASVERLQLAVGGHAVAIIKASNVILTGDENIVTSARNRLCGRVARLERGAVNSDVAIDIGDSKSVGAIVTNASAERLGLHQGAPMCALIKASSVILALPG